MVDSPDPPDDELITRIAGGDREAFAALYRRHRSNVYRFALHVGGLPALAEDVMQDVFVAVIRDAARYRPGRSGVLPWLLGIARNHVRRSQSQRPALPLPADGTLASPALIVEADPLVDLARRQRMTALRRALLELPVKYREVVVLCDLQELSYADAAGALRCAVGTVRSRLHRGRTLLATRLQDHCGEVLCRMAATRVIL